jgi:H+/Cl- antiporter ClcA
MINSIILKVRLHLKHTFDRLHNEELKRNVLQAIPFWIASVITGLIAVLYSWLFLQAENLTAKVFHWHAWILFVLSPACFVVGWWMVSRFSPYAKGSGIPQVMAAIEISSPKTEEKVNKLLGIKVVILKVLSSLTVALGGGAIGR